MKAYPLLLSLLCLSTFASLGQTRINDQKASYVAKEAVNQLHLSEYDYIKLRNVLRSKFQEIEEAAVRYSDDKPMYKEAVSQIESRYDKEIMDNLPKRAKAAYIPHKDSIYASAIAAMNSKK